MWTPGVHVQKQPLDIPVLQHPFSRLISPHLTSPFPISSRLISSHGFLFVIFVCPSNLFHLSAHLISCRLISPFLFSSHLKSSHFVSVHLNSSHRISSFFNRLSFFSLCLRFCSAFFLFSFSPQLFSAHPGCRSRSQSCLRGIMVGGHSASAPRRSATQLTQSCCILVLVISCLWRLDVGRCFAALLSREQYAKKSRQ